ncbi:hypothetical protein DI272_32970 [Streptomyces sp. Act143]|nr:hypothetical protein DI272_32970 [Streptomyces sp. Act143]
MHVVFDETALVAAGRGNALVSRLIHHAHQQQGWFLYATVCALVEADRARPGTAEHIAALPGITVVNLDLPAALAVAREETWAVAHSWYAAKPTPDRPYGSVVVTAHPKSWKGPSVRVLDLRPRQSDGEG